MSSFLNLGLLYISNEDLLARVSIPSHSTDYFPPGVIGQKMRENILSGLYDTTGHEPSSTGSGNSMTGVSVPSVDKGSGLFVGGDNLTLQGFNGSNVADDGMDGLDLGLIIRNVIYIITGG